MGGLWECTQHSEQLRTAGDKSSEIYPLASRWVGHPSSTLVYNARTRPYRDFSPFSFTLCTSQVFQRNRTDRVCVFMYVTKVCAYMHINLLQEIDSYDCEAWASKIFRLRKQLQFLTLFLRGSQFFEDFIKTFSWLDESHSSYEASPTVLKFCWFKC